MRAQSKIIKQDYKVRTFLKNQGVPCYAKCNLNTDVLINYDLNIIHCPSENQFFSCSSGSHEHILYSQKKFLKYLSCFFELMMRHCAQ